MARGSGQPTRAGALCAVRAAAGRCLLAFLLACGLCLTPYSVAIHDGIVVQQEKAYAVAPIVAGAGVILRELAIQAGLSIGAVAVTDAVMCTAGIGKSPYDSAVSYETAGELPPAAPNRPNWPLWENMTAEQKAAWGNSETEYRNAYTAVCTSKVLGVEDYYDELRTWQANGGVESEKPVPDDTTKAKLKKFGEAGKKWAKGGAVAAGTLGGMIAFESLVDFFFGSSEQSLGYTTTGTLLTSNNLYISYAHYSYVYGNSMASDAGFYAYRTNDMQWFNIPNYADLSVQLYASRQWDVYFNPPIYYTTRYSANDYGGGYIGSDRHYGPVAGGSEGQYPFALNIDYPGKIILPGGDYIQNGNTVGCTVLPSYDPIEDTPEELSGSVGNATQLEQNFDDIANQPDQETGKYPAIVVPVGGIVPNVTVYPEIIVNDADTPDEDVNEPTTQPEPYPDPTPDPGPAPSETPEPDPTQFQEDLREKTGELLETSVSGLFPFCLVYDAQRMMGIVTNRIEGSSGYDGTYVDVPMEAFNLGVENWRIDLSPVKQFANYIRPFTPWVLIAGLLAASYSFFLRRGGE